MDARRPRVTIQFCTQCKWMLRAAYYAQELLSTFSTALGEVALQPSTGGTFIVSLETSPTTTTTTTTTTTLTGIEAEAAAVAGGGSDAAGALPSPPPPPPATVVIWDRRIDGSFPETKELKRRVRNVIEPTRDLGHIDRIKVKVEEEDQDQWKEASDLGQAKTGPVPTSAQQQQQQQGEDCQDCSRRGGVGYVEKRAYQ